MINFSKYQGIGNDFIIFDYISSDIPELIKSGDRKVISKICNRNFGIGADGVIIAMNNSGISEFRMRIFNSDGSEAEMCGNGIRCLAKFLLDNNYVIQKNSLSINTLAGNITANFVDDINVKVNMGKPVLTPELIPTDLKIGEYGIASSNINLDNKDHIMYSVGMGNPHMIIFVNDLADVQLSEWGSKLEMHKSFPQKTNVHFAKIENDSLIKLLVWERSCGPTMACGTGACAVLAAALITGKSKSKSTISLPGGNLLVSWPNTNSDIYMTGKALKVFSGSISFDFYQ